MKRIPKTLRPGGCGTGPPARRGHHACHGQRDHGNAHSIAPDDMAFSMNDDEGGEHNFRLVITGKVLINNKERALSDLQAGDQVTVRFDFEDKDMVATLVRCVRD